MIRIHIAQINPTIGDLEGNLARILDEGHRAHVHGVDLAVFPELCLTGHYPGDLLYEPAFLARTEFKRHQAPPILRLRRRAFGTSRRMPIAARLEF
ncbi:MAG TPA: hypothetical protein PKO15_17895 [Fibrobacteria bacterium]|nr:hypothetical protein [Fibrobacteria bacterium]HOX52367.1 hypothetical protein [Fibrobacteria bacterium]